MNLVDAGLIDRYNITGINMRYPLITLIIAVVWTVILIVSWSFADIAKNLYYLAMISTVLFFYIGFQIKTK